jgi:hypothetical protein
MNDRERLEAIVKVVRQYLPPDGIYGKEAMGKIIELVDPLPPKKEWVGLTDEEKNFLRGTWVGFRDIEKVIETIDELLRRRTHD